MVTSSERRRQLRDVAVDLPRMIASPLYRARHLRWGATDGEAIATLPGDEFLPQAQYRCTRAVTIDSPPDAVWPWLVQAGCTRAGFYSDDLLDNLGRPSARVIVPELQHLEVGQWVPMTPGIPTLETAFKVDSFEPGSWLLWRKPDSTWVWSLSALDGERTRLLTRVCAVYDWKRPALALLGVALMEFGDYAMMRRMLLGIKYRAEDLAATAGPIGDVGRRTQ